jgi:hypothetical protein
MRNQATVERWVRRIGVAAGVVLVCALMLAFRVPDGSGKLGADVIVSISPTGELGVDPAGPFLTATGLRPGSAASGDFRVANQTGKTLAVRLRALPDSRDLDRLLTVRIDAGHATRPIFTGRLGALRTHTRDFRLRPGEERTLSVRAGLPAGLQGGWAGRISTVKLELTSAVLEGSRG